MINFVFRVIFHLNSLIEKRKRSFYKWKVIKDCVSYEEPLTTGGLVTLNKNTTLGKNCNFNGLEVRGGGNVYIGNNFHSAKGCIFFTQFHNYDTGNAVPYDRSYILKDIKIEDNVWLGLGVYVLGGVTIGEGAIIQAGSVVVSDIPKYGIAGGHPAKVFKYRDKEHYERLKSEGKFN